MSENILSQSDMAELLGQSLFDVWQQLCSVIDEKYEMEQIWNSGGKKSDNMMKQKPIMTGNG